jgi:GNAT superfamily N-acetyltransferase
MLDQYHSDGPPQARPDEKVNDGISFRLYQPRDWGGVRRLFEETQPNGYCLDDETHDFPFGEGTDIGWIAEADGQIVGVVVSRERPGHVACISHLREHPRRRGRNIALRLAWIALGHAMEQQCLKIVLHSVNEAGVAADFERAGLLPAGGHGSAGHKRLDFYLDLYRRLDRVASAGNELAGDLLTAPGGT